MHSFSVDTRSRLLAIVVCLVAALGVGLAFASVSSACGVSNVVLEQGEGPIEGGDDSLDGSEEESPSDEEEDDVAPPKPEFIAEGVTATDWETNVGAWDGPESATPATAEAKTPESGILETTSPETVKAIRSGALETTVSQKEEVTPLDRVLFGPQFSSRDVSYRIRNGQILRRFERPNDSVMVMNSAVAGIEEMPPVVALEPRPQPIPAPNGRPCMAINPGNGDLYFVDDAPPPAQREPAGTAVLPDGGFLIPDVPVRHRIRVIRPNGAVQTIADTPSPLRTRIAPTSLVLDNRTILFCDGGKRLCQLGTADGSQIRVFAQNCVGQMEFETELLEQLVSACTGSPARRAEVFQRLHERSMVFLDPTKRVIGMFAHVNRAARYRQVLQNDTGREIPRDIVLLIAGHIQADPVHHYRTLLIRQCLLFLHNYKSK